jgi:hypothetical protein
MNFVRVVALTYVLAPTPTVKFIAAFAVMLTVLGFVISQRLRWLRQK